METTEFDNSQSAPAQEKLKAIMEKFAYSNGRVTKPESKKLKLEEFHLERVAATMPKHEARKAYAPTLFATLKRKNPAIRRTICCMFPNNRITSDMRTRNLKIFYDEFIKQGVTKDDSETLAQHVEKSIFDQGKGRVGYESAVASLLKQLREKQSGVIIEYKEIRRGSRLLAQAFRTKSLIFTKLPAEMRKEVINALLETKFLSREFARRHFEDCFDKPFLEPSIEATDPWIPDEQLGPCSPKRRKMQD